MYRLSAVIILADIFQFDIVCMNLTFQPGSEDPIEWRSTPLNTKLNHRRVSRVFALIVCCRVPKLDNVITACGHDICNGLFILDLRDKVRCNERPASDRGFA